MKIYTLIILVFLTFLASCSNIPEYPVVISGTDDLLETHSSLAASLGVVGVYILLIIWRMVIRRRTARR